MTLSTSYFGLTWEKLLIKFFILQASCHLVCFAGELRFCYNGPQRIQYKDCPGGFVANHVVKASCMYYYKASGVPNMETYLTDNICDPSNIRQLDPDFQEFTKTEFQLIEFDADVVGGPTEGSDPAVDKCNSTCLNDWLKPKYWFPSKILKDKPELNDTVKEEYRKEYVSLTKKLLIKIINDDENEAELETRSRGNEGSSKAERTDLPIGNASDSTAPVTSLMNLLAQAMKITYQKCSPFVETSFYTLTFRTMIELTKMNANFPDMNILPFKRIMKILDKCETEQTCSFIINGTGCGDKKQVVETITDLKNNITKPHRLQPFSFRWGRYDPIIEAAWSAIAFVHAFCFDSFAQDMLHYSLFIKAMTEIFVQPHVEKHWMYPFPVGKGLTLWTMAYDTPDIKNQMNSLDACVQAAYVDSVFETRLDRPFYRQDLIENPEYEDDPDTPKPGWLKSIDEYWKMYEQEGFNEMVNALGYCAPSIEALKSKSDHYAEETCFRDDKEAVNNPTE